MGGVTDVILGRSLNFRETSAQHFDDVGSIIKRESRLGQVGDSGGWREFQIFRFLNSPNDDDPVRSFTKSSFDFNVFPMPDQKNDEFFLGITFGLKMDLGHKRACGVKHFKIPFHCLFPYLRGNSVGGKDRMGTFRDLIQFVHKDHPLFPQSTDHMAVVDDFMADINGRSELFQSLFHNGNGPVDSCTQKPLGLANITSSEFPGLILFWASICWSIVKVCLN